MEGARSILWEMKDAFSSHGFSLLWLRILVRSDFEAEPESEIPLMDRFTYTTIGDGIVNSVASAYALRYFREFYEGFFSKRLYHRLVSDFSSKLRSRVILAYLSIILGLPRNDVAEMFEAIVGAAFYHKILSYEQLADWISRVFDILINWQIHLEDFLSEDLRNLLYLIRGFPGMRESPCVVVCLSDDEGDRTFHLDFDGKTEKVSLLDLEEALQSLNLKEGSASDFPYRHSWAILRLISFYISDLTLLISGLEFCPLDQMGAYLSFGERMSRLISRLGEVFDAGE